MREIRCSKTRRRRVFLKVLGIMALVILMLVSIAGATPFAYITNYDSNNISVIDTATNTVTAAVNVGSHPYGVSVSPDGTKVYVANHGSDNVSVIDTATNTVISTVPVGSFPREITVTPDGKKAYVTNWASNTVSVIDIAKNTVETTVNVGYGPEGIAVNPAGTTVYVTNWNTYPSTVSVIDTATNIVTATVNVGTNAHGVAVNPTGTKVYVANSASSNVSVIDTATNRVTATINVPKGSLGVAVNPDGTKVYVTGGEVSVIDTATNTVTATVNVGWSPFGVAVSPDGTKVYVANWNSNDVSVIDTATNKVTATVIVGSKPAALGQFIGSGPARSLSFNPQTVELRPGSSQNVQIIMDKVPDGLAGFNVTIAILDPEIVEITKVSFPSWGLLSKNSTLPSSSVWMKTVDLDNKVHPGDTSVSLGTITLTGKKAGSSDLNILKTMINDDKGSLINPVVNTGKVHVILLPTFPGYTNPPKDPDHDGLYEDINGNGMLDFDDIVAYYDNMEWIEENAPVAFFDFNSNGLVDFDDVVKLYDML